MGLVDIFKRTGNGTVADSKFSAGEFSTVRQATGDSKDSKADPTLRLAGDLFAAVKAIAEEVLRRRESVAADEKRSEETDTDKKATKE